MAKHRAMVIVSGGMRYAPCSKFGKREVIADWITSRYSPGEYELALGFDIDEAGRLRTARKYWQHRAGWDVNVFSPLLNKPHADRISIVAELLRAGLEIPQSYRDGFSHNNCGGGCVQAGINQFALLFRKKPDVYRYWEYQEQSLQRYLKKEVTILRDRRNGQTRRLSLAQLRKRIEGGEQFGQYVATCACFTQHALPGFSK